MPFTFTVNNYGGSPYANKTISVSIPLLSPIDYVWTLDANGSFRFVGDLIDNSYGYTTIIEGATYSGQIVVAGNDGSATVTLQVPPPPSWMLPIAIGVVAVLGIVLVYKRL